MKQANSIFMVILVMFMNAMSAKAQPSNSKQFNLMIEAMKAQPGGQAVDASKLALLKSDNDDIRRQFMEAYTYKTELSGDFQIVEPSAKNLKDTVWVKDLVADARILKLGMLNEANDGSEVIMFAYNAVTKEFAFVTGFKPSAPQMAQVPNAGQPQGQGTVKIFKGSDGKDYKMATDVNNAPVMVLANEPGGVAFTDADGRTYKMGTTSNGSQVMVLDGTTQTAGGGQAVTQPFGTTASAGTNQNGGGTQQTPTGKQKASKTTTHIVETEGDPNLLAQADAEHDSPKKLGRHPATESFTEVDCSTCPGGKQKMIWDREVNDWVPYGSSTTTLKPNQVLLDAQNKPILMERNREEHRMDDGRGIGTDPESEHMANPAERRATAQLKGWHMGSFIGCPGPGFVLSSGYWVNAGYQASRAWNSNGNCYNNGGAVVVLNNDSYTGFQTR